MLRLTIIGICSLFLLGLNSCKLLNKPTKSPENLIITWHKNGGMLPSYSKLYISEDSCAWESYNEINLQQTPFNLSPTEIKELYAVLTANNYTKIESKHKPVLDRGGSDITIQVDEEKYKLLNSRSNFIIEKYISNYKAIEQAIIQKYEDYNSKHVNTLTLDLDSSITNSKYTVVLYIDRKEVYNESKSDYFTPITHSITNQSINCKVLFMKKSSSFQTVVNKYELTLHDLTSTKNIILTLVDDKLTLK